MRNKLRSIQKLWIKYYWIKIFHSIWRMGRPDMLILKFLIYAKNGLKFQLYNYGNHYRDFTYINDLFQMIYPLIKNYKKIKRS